jgi:hypothetical protein
VGPLSVWVCAKNLAPTGIRSPDRPAHTQSLYRLSSITFLLYCFVETIVAIFLDALPCVDIAFCYLVDVIHSYQFCAVESISYKYILFSKYVNFPFVTLLLYKLLSNITHF